MSMTWEEAQEEEAYAHMVEKILSSHKGEIIDDFLESHKEDIIDEFISERMAAYYRHHPNLTVPADTAIGEAQKLIEISPAAPLLFSRSAVEITLRDVLLKPVAFGMVHDENNGPLIAELVIGSHNFTRLLFNVLEDYGLDLKQVRRPGSHKKLWEEMEEIKQIRNRILHSGGTASRDAAEFGAFEEAAAGAKLARDAGGCQTAGLNVRDDADTRSLPRFVVSSRRVGTRDQRETSRAFASVAS